MSVWRWPSARWGVTVLTVQGERADRATQRWTNKYDKQGGLQVLDKKMNVH